jgi:hypothetical protein
MSDTARPVSGVMHRIWISALVFGALAAILGVAMLVWPGPSIVVAAALFGAYLVLSGVAMVVLAFALPAASGAGRFLYFLSGALSVILGILAFRHFGEGYAILLLAIWIAVGFYLLRGHQRPRRCRGAGLSVRLDRDVGPCGRNLADHPRRDGSNLRIRHAQRCEEGRQHRRHRGPAGLRLTIRSVPATTGRHARPVVAASDERAHARRADESLRSLRRRIIGAGGGHYGESH